MTKKEALTIPDDARLLEGVLTNQMSFMDAIGWRECIYAYRKAWLDDMVAIGHVRQVGDPTPAWPAGTDSGGREYFNYYKYEVTEAGLVLVDDH